MRSRIFIACFLLLCVAFLAAKTKVDFRLLNSFSIDRLQGDWNTARLCVADSLLLVIDTADSAKTVSLAYDFKGNKIDTFKIPPDSGYVQLIFVNYLYDSKRIAIFEPRKANIDFYSLEGKPLGSKQYLSDWSLYLNALEFYDAPYYMVFNLREAEYDNTVTSSMTWCREKNAGEMQLLRKACFVHETLKDNNSPFPYHLMMDNNTDRYMTMVDERTDEYVVTNPDTTSWNVIRIKRNKADHLSKVVTGENYFLLMTRNNQMKYTPTSGVYDKRGRKILAWSGLKQYETKGEGIIDIVGDKMFTIRWKENTIRIYQVSPTVNK